VYVPVNEDTHVARSTGCQLAKQCAVKGAGLQWVKLPPGNWFAPPGSNRSGGEGNQTVGAFGVEGHVGDSVSVQAVTQVNAEQAPKKQLQEPTGLLHKGRPLTVEKHERTGSIEPAGVRATACRQRRPDATREAPSGGRGHGPTGNS
jgi:hypothetical protein